MMEWWREICSSTTTSKLLAAAIGLSGSMLAFEAVAAEATDQRCAKSAEIRRIEIRFADDEGTLPCRVIYRPEGESDTVGIVSWQDLPSLSACEAKANDVIDRLKGEGWSCASDQSTSVDSQLQENAALEDQLLGEAGAALDKPSDAPTTPPLVEVDDGEADSLQFAEVDEPARFVDNPDIAPPPDTLIAMIKDDIAWLDQTLSGVLVAMVAGYGDLNADDSEDALVLLTYTSPQPAYRQYLAVYLFDGETYQLTATKPVGSNIDATINAKVDAIDRGVIHLSLEAFQPGDRSCCPSGERRLALALRDLNLIEIDADALTR